MKHALSFCGVTLISALLLSACQTNNPTASKTNSITSSLTQSDSSATKASSDSALAESEKIIEEKKLKPVEYTYSVNPAIFTIEPLKKEGNTKVALLTFDDAPDKYAVEIAKKLKSVDAPAVFFVNGMYAESDEGKQKLKEIHDMGFEIGNHSQTHANLSEITPEEQRQEIVKTNELVYEITGVKPRFFRAPYGVNTDVSAQIIEEEKMVFMNWTYGYDWEADYQNPEALTDIMLNTDYLSDGANLLMHDRSWTSEAAIAIAEGLKEKGYTLIDPALIASPEREESTQ
ncbi:Peptidoglycan/xylan/chitin deacetylase, PgdA/CDA1 family [Carnobacterium iners]|uniref:Peptidoglycan/xylan/chitin deacetylase, PgdA/CDA1 family n=1 Tax=Carnobacterium iners TaxID=1073423 RepID=A0A1X7NHG9_9LACT|nr:polysaccharide deacetylase family protein [Carnobacterium iners]SEK39361.1 Peptidoglycan/xylan/chitin deacetylase, PgdA/CDA1 family [Carnobacterium iners]SMH36396.1 Peptidoglycan/xylan/chitin deacetylase, PgdA/CDA1 family [Carnobacterium iners]